jgi:hypothetical protein
MFIDRIDKETTDISRVVLDMGWWLDAGETLTTVVSSEILVGMFGWSEPPYPPFGSQQPFDITPLQFDRPVEIDDTGTQLVVFVKIGSPGVAYTCQFVLDGTSTRRVTIELGVQVTGVPIGSAPGPIPSWLAVTISDTPPQNPQPGQLWFDSIAAQMYLWYVDPTSAEWTVVAADNGKRSIRSV